MEKEIKMPYSEYESMVQKIKDLESDFKRAKEEKSIFITFKDGYGREVNLFGESEIIKWVTECHEKVMLTSRASYNVCKKKKTIEELREKCIKLEELINLYKKRWWHF